ncbi:efflux RND transporter permease subunit [Desulfomicrobium baculatum]|uniref:Acriflavin resistance protein n=1 Tax=Desulfomicrobium baculatum (strain DSM 4028 / VKM B-1378 / X) TaxID=525897 RepID=C7LQI9_DESBD|nr:efflux RND transporter permease subunit [Desulfomicrobium baculatum]ACU90391.1 acriflavin resistance protein [Desulfomicrobium baculatum DSM 4028]
MSTQMSFMDRIIRFCLDQKLVVILVVCMALGWGFLVAPFAWHAPGIERDPVPVDAIPDIGENQQIVFTSWAGRSPQDVQDQITYPLTVSLLGMPGVKTVRSYSMLGFSTIYVIFDEDVEFYWSRTRLLEKINSLPPSTLPSDVRPTLGPDATALGQVFWYTLEGRDPEGRPTGGWDPDEIRTVQDWYVRYALTSAEGVSEVASVGGFVREYQIEVDPDAMRAAGVSLPEVVGALKMANLEVGAGTMEVNRVEYVIRGIGFIKNLDQIRTSVIKMRDSLPITVDDVAHVSFGPANRRGLLDKGGVEAVGGVVTVRYGENPLAAIDAVKAEIARIAPGLPEKILADGTRSKLTIVPFYDRAGLIHETLDTLGTALYQQILITIIVVLVLVMHLRSSFLISALLPMAVMMCFIAMKQFKVDANIVALSGIAIAIGTMVDMGIIICESILQKMDSSPEDTPMSRVVFEGASEVGSAVLTAVSTTIVGFLPVFFMTGAEGKLFGPLAYTKTFALVASIIVALTILPAGAALIFRRRSVRPSLWFVAALVVAGLVVAVWKSVWIGTALVAAGLYRLIYDRLSTSWQTRLRWGTSFGLALAVAVFLALDWLPLGLEKGRTVNTVFVLGLIALLLGFFQLFSRSYGWLLNVFLHYKALFLVIPVFLTLFGGVVWLGAAPFLALMPEGLRTSSPMVAFVHAFPGLGKEFMPPLDEGSFLYMPTTMPHASLGEVKELLALQDMSIQAIPEVDSAVGKLGRADSPLDPAPVSMVETVINYKNEYLLDGDGRRQRFVWHEDAKDYFRDPAGKPVPAADGMPYLVRGWFERDDQGRLIPDEDGQPLRLWRPALDPDLNPGRAAWDGIRSPEDIWDEIVKAADVPGMTSAPKLQPIAARIVMLQSGMRAPMGVKIKGPDLRTIESVAMEVERLLKEVPMVQPAAVVADRIVGKPYLEIVPDREAISRYGIMLATVQEIIQASVGGMVATTTIEGREVYPIRVRYMRDLRDSAESLERIPVPAASGRQIPLGQLAEIRYVRGPQAIKSEDTFLLGYVLFDKKPGYAEVDVVESAKAYLEQQRVDGKLVIPAGVTIEFAGSYENQVRAQKKLMVVLPVALMLIVIILYLQFGSIATTLMVFSGIFTAWSGGFTMIWLYGQEWFLNFHVAGVDMRELFQVHPINLSVAIWVGFLALFGIASDDGVLMATFLDESKARFRPDSIASIRNMVLEGAKRRIRPAVMTSATTILALVPILTSSGRGSDIMIPMAIPSFGGMVFAIITVFVVPVLYCWVEEVKFRLGRA